MYGLSSKATTMMIGGDGTQLTSRSPSPHFMLYSNGDSPDSAPLIMTDSEVATPPPPPLSRSISVQSAVAGSSSTTTSPSSGWHPKAVLFLLLWYFWSACTLFLNKYVVFYMKGDATFLACSQMWVTALLGLFQMYFPMGMFDPPPEKRKRPKNFCRNMFIVGSLRFLTVLLGLVALDYVTVSFTETVKSSAPAVTVVISRIMTGEITGLYVNLSLLPVMGGLALCSANELSFHVVGFVAAVGCNVSECLQNVFSKILISGDAHAAYNPAELQFYTALCSTVIQLPTLAFMSDPATFSSGFSEAFLYCCVLNGVFFHFQTISAYVLMDFISPVTHSVANTAKRALLIWLSVLLFGNEVTPLSAAGTAVVILGVLLYNRAREFDRTGRMPARLLLSRVPSLISMKEARDS